MLGELTLAAVFAAGIISFLSPCVLPLVPAYLTYMTGASLEELSSDERKPELSRFPVRSGHRLRRRHHLDLRAAGRHGDADQPSSAPIRVHPVDCRGASPSS